MNRQIKSQSSSFVWKRKATWRVVVSTVVFLSMSLILLASSEEANTAAGEANLEGSWWVAVTLGIPDGPPPFEVVESYANGGQSIDSQRSYPDWLWASSRADSIRFPCR